jgi:hypothetical protein
MILKANGTKTPNANGSRSSLRTARKPGVLHCTLACLILTRVVRGETGDIAFSGGGLFAVLFLFIIGDECHCDYFL